ncbi:Nucleolar protein 12 [Kalmusia sp. IMI 367209]|nr:Nucleolar protein 12 [Kalmusia sp. IMI 367209]
MGAPKKSSGALAAADQKSIDPSLASLFTSSLGPVKPPPKSRYQELVKQHAIQESNEDESEASDEDAANPASDREHAHGAEESDAGSGSSDEAAEQDASDDEAALAQAKESVLNGAQERPNKKRKRGGIDDDVEDVYMQKIAREEAKDEEKRNKKRRTKAAEARDAGGAASEAEDSDEEESFAIPKHETLVGAADNDDEVEKAARTVFLGNVSNEAITSKAAEKQLKQHLSSFLADLADNKPPHKVESIRFRSTAFAGALPKRAAFAKKEVMDSTTKSTNAYVIYSTKIAAREAVKKLNGTVVLGRHLRVDSIAHPAKVDHRRCVFVGNLGFVDDESKLNTEDGEKKKKNKPPGDVEEGLWIQFSKAGKVESVRVPRDARTRVGKGFAYVQFEDENAVEAALQFNDQKYPPLLPRKLRVSRAKAQKSKPKKPTDARPSRASPDGSQHKGAYNAKISGEERSQRGRAKAMLGKAAAFKSAESFVFEGHRASSKQGTSGLKLGGKKKGPNGRKSRSKAWKAGGGKK